MSLLVQNNYFKENGIVSGTYNKRDEYTGKLLPKETSTNKASETGKAEEMTPEEELEAFKKDFYNELSNIKPYKTVSNVAIKISEDAFIKMKEDPKYKEKILTLLERDLTSSYGTKDVSVLISVGSSLSDYRGDTWNVGYDSEFFGRSHNSFYKKTSSSDKEKHKDLLVKYLEKRQETKRIQQEIADEKFEKVNTIREALIKRDAEKAYNNQIFLYTDIMK